MAIPATKGTSEKIWSWDGAMAGKKRLPKRRRKAGETMSMREMPYSRPESFVAGIFSVLLIDNHLLGVSSLMLG